MDIVTYYRRKLNAQRRKEGTIPPAAPKDLAVPSWMSLNQGFGVTKRIDPFKHQHQQHHHAIQGQNFTKIDPRWGTLRVNIEGTNEAACHNER